MTMTGTIPDVYVNKTIPFKFMGHELRFDLSHGLFSSFDVDDGTRLLLKSLAQHVELSAVRSILDLGCGAGIIGICICKASPDATAVLQDRDALAAAFAAANAEKNGCGGATAVCGLAFQGLDESKYDLIVSNLPAKAGKPVLEGIFHRIPRYLRNEGLAAVVVIDAIANFALETVHSQGFNVVHQEKSAGYSVIHFQPNPEAAQGSGDRDALIPYIRAKCIFSSPGLSYPMETAYNLPDFDILGHRIETAFEVLAEVGIAGRLVFWNPGQGHIPVFLSRRHGRSISDVFLCGRDALEIAITWHNLAGTGVRISGSAALAHESLMPDACGRGGTDFLCAVPNPIPRVPWQDELASAALTVLKPGGRLFVVGKSTEIQRFMQRTRGFSVQRDRRRMGFRAVLLARS